MSLNSSIVLEFVMKVRLRSCFVFLLYCTFFCRQFHVCKIVVKGLERQGAVVFTLNRVSDAV